MSARKPDPRPALHAYRVSAGGSEAIDWETGRGLAASLQGLGPGGWVWLHIDRSDADVRRWLSEEAGLGEEVVDAMVSDDTRPRAAELDGGVLLILRGLNRDADSVRQDPVSLRVFVDARRVISMRLRPFSATYELDRRLSAGAAPDTTGAFLVELIETTLDQIEARLDDVGDRFDKLEEMSLLEPSGRLRGRRGELNALTRGAIVLRRYLRPQREALARLAALSPDWLPASELPALREAADQTARIVEDLDELRERAALIGDEMSARLNDRMNRTLVTLAAVSMMFLPLTVVTGLFGANLAGIPFKDEVWSFGALSGSLVLLAGVTWAAVRRLDRG